MDAQIKKLNRKAQEKKEELVEVRGELEKVIVGQEKVLDRLLMGVLCDAHILLDGMPGLLRPFPPAKAGCRLPV